MANICVIGAGIVGLAAALKILEKNPGIKITILEKETTPASHQTGNNSGVIHAGVYYKPGSLKAINCRKGYGLLIDFCKREAIDYELCGKLIVATNKEELIKLDELHDRALKNSLAKTKKIGAEELKEIEPHASGIAALHVPYTGIVDYRQVAGRYADIIRQKFGSSINYNEKVLEIRKQHNNCEVVTENNSYVADFVINTAGLYSDSIAKMTESKLDVRIIPFRGEYVELVPEKQYLVKNLIYPVPDPNFPFLGVHFTRMIEGGIEAGPNAVWAFSREGYAFNEFNWGSFTGDLKWKGFRKVMKQYWKMGLGEYYRSFNKIALERSMQKLIPEITRKDIMKGGAGVRAQACHEKYGLVDDFLIKENKYAINVLNAPSPAATASLAIGEAIAELALKRI